MSETIRLPTNGLAELTSRFIPAETIAGFKSQGAPGLYTEDQALRSILAGTGLSYQINNTGGVTISVGR